MNSKLVNFFNEDNKVISKNKSYIVLIVIFFILFIILQNLKLKNNINDLEAYIDQNNKYMSVSNLSTNDEYIPVSKIESIIAIANDKNIKYLQLNNKKLSLRGYSVDSSSIKSYTDRLNKINKINNISIESINKDGDTYSFEIQANIGVSNEI